MQIPNDLIKSTNLEKSKDRIIHEFEYVNGKFIHHYVLGGEHELTPQEIVDCLNALATIDCDLQTSYAYIKGQTEKIKDLQSQLAITEKALELACEYVIEEWAGTELDDDAMKCGGWENYFKSKAKEMLGNEKRR